MTTGRLASVTTLIVAIVWLLLDQASKLLAVARLEGEPPIDLGVIILALVRNPGGAFSIPGLFPGVFVIVTVVVLVLIARALPHTDRLWLAVGYGLVAGGALGNCVDRLFRAPGFPNGHVIDFVKFGFWETFPTFNVADAGITCGAILVGVLLLLVDREERARQRVRREGGESVRPESPGFGPVDEPAPAADTASQPGAPARPSGTPAWYGAATAPDREG